MFFNTIQKNQQSRAVMQLDALDLYNFLFHPLHKNHSQEVRGISIITNLVLTALSGGLYLLIFGAVHTREYVVLQNETTTLHSSKITNVYKKQFPFESRPITFIDIPTLKKERRALVPKLTNFRTDENWRPLQKNTGHADSDFEEIMFPTSQPIGSGKYRLNPNHVEILRQDEEFMDHANDIVDLVALSYGWDLQNNVEINNNPAQRWHSSYDQRLTAMLRFVTEFGLTEKYKLLLAFIESHDIQYLDSTPKSLLAYLQPII